MKIAFGCDHAGYPHKAGIIEHLKAQKIEVIDFGCECSESCDYPPIALAAAKAVAEGKAEKAVLVCGTGVGMSIAANKVKGIRAACCWAGEIAALVAQHNAANILCLPGRFAKTQDMIKWIDTWLSTPSSKEPRHLKRLEEISSFEMKG